jgi:GT2 family glycosyltransferase
MNKGVRLARGAFIGFLNADDWFVRDDAVSTMASALECSGAATAFADIAYVDRNHPSRRLRTWRTGPYRPGAFARGWCPPHPTFLARREVLLALGGFDLRYRLAADFDLMLRALEVRRETSVYVRAETVHMRAGGATGRGISTIAAQNSEILRSLRRAGCRVSLPHFLACKAYERVMQRMRSPGYGGDQISHGRIASSRCESW